MFFAVIFLATFAFSAKGMEGQATLQANPGVLSISSANEAVLIGHTNRETPLYPDQEDCIINFVKTQALQTLTEGQSALIVAFNRGDMAAQLSAEFPAIEVYYQEAAQPILALQDKLRSEIPHWADFYGVSNLRLYGESKEKKRYNAVIILQPNLGRSSFKGFFDRHAAELCKGGKMVIVGASALTENHPLIYIRNKSNCCFNKNKNNVKLTCSATPINLLVKSIIDDNVVHFMESVSVEEKDLSHSFENKEAFSCWFKRMLALCAYINGTTSNFDNPLVKKFLTRQAIESYWNAFKSHEKQSLSYESKMLFAVGTK